MLTTFKAFSFFTCSWSFFAYSGKVRLISALRNCKQRSLTVSKEAPTVSKIIGHGEVRVYRGTGVSRGVQRTTWERSLKNWELQISCLEEFLDGENVLGLVPASLPHALGYACTFCAPTSPPPKKASPEKRPFYFGPISFPLRALWLLCPYEGQSCGRIDREGSCSKAPGALSKDEIGP